MRIAAGGWDRIGHIYEYTEDHVRGVLDRPRQVGCEKKGWEQFAVFLTHKLGSVDRSGYF